MKRVAMAGLIVALTSAAFGQDWVAPMRVVHQAYTDVNGVNRGSIGRFGDSITNSKASFYPLSWNTYGTGPGMPEYDALRWIRGWMTSASWRWQDDDQGLGGSAQDDFKFHGCLGGTRSTWPLSLCDSEWVGHLPGERLVDYWLRVDNAEMAVIMWGSNDLGDGSISVTTYKNSMRQVVQACKANGTIPILMTCPPRTDFDNSTTGWKVDKAVGFHQAIVDLAAEQQVPLVEFHDEITTRRPHNPPTDTWDGHNSMWSAYSGYEVPTLMARDGLHPSNWSGGKNDFTESSLNTNGFTLRNYMTLMAVKEVYDQVINPTPPHHVGDANGDDEVGIADLSAVADNYGKSPATWVMGDFNFDGEVGIADLSAVADNYGWGSNPLSGGSIPEPATIALVAAGALALLRRRNTNCTD